jgi:hypothetical protein
MKLFGICAAVLTAAITFNSVSAPPRPRAAPAAQAIAITAPFRAAVFFDLTASRDRARIAASLDDFAPMFDRLRTSGGEIGFGQIREDSDKPLIRCFVPVPPEPPVLTSPANSNVFAAANARKRDDAERKKYETKLRAWQADANASINAFIAAIMPLLDAPPTVPMTDITAAVERGDLMLAEPSPFTRAADTAIILITDGIHNATAKEVPTLRSHAPVAIVNGVGSLGALAKLNPPALRFESTAAAIRYLTGDGGANAR